MMTVMSLIDGKILKFPQDNGTGVIQCFKSYEI